MKLESKYLTTLLGKRFKNARIGKTVESKHSFSL